jgi:VanZ family protein
LPRVFVASSSPDNRARSLSSRINVAIDFSNFVSSGVFRKTPLIYYWLPVFCWMILIFIGSTSVLSAQHTSRFIGPFLRWLKPGISEETIHRVQIVVRKSGHLGEYGVLALLSWRALAKPRIRVPTAWSWRHAGIAAGIATLYAISDEIHQSFIPSRGASPWDVLIDACGAGVALLLLWILGRWRRLW